MKSQFSKSPIWQMNIYHQFSRRYSCLLTLFGFIIIALIITWPLAVNFTTEYAGGRSDLRVHQWTFWWVKHTLSLHQSPYFSDMLYYPNGVSLTSHSFGWVSIGIWLLLQMAVGGLVAYNLLAVGVLALNGFCMFLLARDIIPIPLAAFIAGVIFATWPYTISHHYDHPNLTMLFWIPLALLFMRRMVIKQSVRYALLTAVCLGLTSINSWHLILIITPLVALWFLYLIYQHARQHIWGTLRLTLLTSLVSLFIILPFAAPILIDQFQQGDAAGISGHTSDSDFTDVMAYFTAPALYDTLYKDAELDPSFTRPYRLIIANSYYVPFLGYLAILLALMGVIGQWQKARLWALLTSIYLLFALGATLTINGQSFTQIPLPYRLIHNTLIGTIIRRPHRINLVLGLPMALLAAWGFVVVLNRLKASRLRQPSLAILTTLICTAVIVTETRSAIPYTTTPYEIPAWHAQLALNEETFGILDLPTQDRGYDKFYMSYQVVHGKPIAVGHVSRLPKTANDFLEVVPFVARFLDRHESPDDTLVNISHQLNALAAGNIRYVVLHKTFLVHIDPWRDWFVIEPAYEDEEVIVYHTAPQYGRDFSLKHHLTENIGLIRVDVTPDIVVQQGLLKINARWGTIAVPEAVQTVCFSLTNDEQSPVPLSCQPISNLWPVSQWTAHEVVKADYLLSVDQTIPPGSYTLTAQLTDDTGQPWGSPAQLNNIQIAAYAPATLTNIQWDTGLKLNGYTAQTENDTLSLDMYWQPQKWAGKSYVIFVHLLDQETGQLVAQSDAIPHEWRYPTYTWDVGEMVIDYRTLSLQEVPPGNYIVSVGLYNQASGERVTAVNDEGATVDHIRLTTITR